MMQSTYEKIIQHYTMAVDVLYEIGKAYYTSGRFADAQHMLRTSLQLLEASEVQPQHRLKLLLLYGQVLIVNHMVTREDAETVFEPILQAKQLAEEIHDQQGIADGLSLLGNAHYTTIIIGRMKRGESPDSPQDQSQYAEALAYQQQALEMREALHDTRGISESLFQIGVIYERWKQYERSEEYYAKARQIAEQSGHIFEQTEPARHFAIHVLLKGDLDQALTLALHALTLREKAGFKPYQPLDHLLIRDIYQAKGDTANAQLHTQKASILAEEMGMHTLVASMPNVKDRLAAQQPEA